ncbi:MAG: peroxide stress protein YaaA [bacterium]|nr:peroxide stress protein YaaA [bacterium]
MRIIISPAKKMIDQTDLLEYRDMPSFMKEASALLAYMKGLSYTEAKELWNCNDKIAELNYDRFQTMDLTRNLTPAIFSYEGIQYQYMAPNVLDQDALDYIEEHLRVISGFYGVLCPLDGIVPYRLEMQAKLAGHESKNLYEYWGSKLADKIWSETDVILNLASKEYSKCISKYVTEKQRFITCVFGELVNDKVREKSTQVKMARGEMVRFLAENQITDLEQVKTFDRFGFVFNEERSDDTTFVFVKEVE